ncbi:MAG: oligosaccharide flippase family protein [Candidatus Enterenecus sp.]
MSNPTPKKNSFFGGAAILAVGIVLVKFIGFLFKIPLGNIISDAAFSDFNTAYYIYSLLIIVSTGGLPVALSKMVSEANALGRHNQVHKTFRLSLIAFCSLGILSMVIMLIFPKQLADLMNNSHSWYCIVTLAPAMFFICPLSAMRGYFQGHSLMTPTAVSQIIEALCKLVIGLTLASILVGRGADESITAAGAIAGVSVGCALGVVYMFLCYRRHSRSVPRSNDVPDESREILSTLLKLAIPITLGSSVIAVTNVLDTSIIFGRLQDAVGFSEEEARVLKGVYDKALTLYNLPSAFMTPITASVIPAVSAARAVKDYRQGARVSETALRTTALFAFPAGVGLFALGTPIIRLLYPGTNVELAGWMLSVLGLASIGVCFMLVCNSIMQAHRLVTIPMVTSIVGCLLKIIVTFALVGNPDVNICGAPVSTLVCFGMIALLDLFIIKRALPRSLSYVRAFLKPGLAAIVMGVAAWAVYGLCSRFLLDTATFGGNAVATLLTICVAVVIYAALILLTRAISKDDLALMPKGDRIARLLRIR